MAGVLDGIRVLDFGRYIAGPWCAALLGDFGAEVIRIERIGGGEDRAVLPLSETDQSGAMFLQVNRNKRGMTLDPAREQGREVVRRLVATADVVVANLPEAALKALGLDHATLSAIKPDVILTTATAFGYGGPYERKVGFDTVAQAMSGIMYLSG
jgi:crotonobetainyl-CoA:carnitine CoA-transferase CaiB-like acyl-CoA transferase